MSITWEESMSTGIQKIDEQHKDLINHLNELGTAMQRRKGRDEIKKILSFIEKYVRTHFSYEEECMEKYKCPVAAANKREHEKFVKMFTELKEQTHEDINLSVVIKTHRELTNWLIKHIWKIDTELKSCVKNH